jgi:hypothetical protein
MAKPICVVHFDMETNIDREAPQQAIDLKLNDHYVLVVPSRYRSELMDLEVLREPDFTQTDHYDIKKLIVDSLNNLKDGKAEIGY